MAGLGRGLERSRQQMVIIIILACLAFSLQAQTRSSISRHGITWEFDTSYECGQFANGDWWVTGPVNITRIDPASTTSNGRTINGSMINPAVGGVQGYDSETYAQYGPNYDAELNVALGVSQSSPLDVLPGSSLISTISHPEAGHRPQLLVASVLTVLDSAAPSGAFRPPYVGVDKTVRWNANHLNYAKLRSLPAVANTPDLLSVTAHFDRVWIEQYTSWLGRYLHPEQNQPDYGRDMANRLANGLLLLQLDFTDAEKEPLLLRLVQYGIDIYGVAVNGGRWEDLGGHNQGRKMPLLLAGMVLNDANILAYADAGKHFIFQEDRQTWYVTKSDVERPLYQADGRPREEYRQEDVGVAEWGEQHTRQPKRDGRNWDAYYRRIVGHSILGHILTARLMSAESLWNWSAVFDYGDRYYLKEKDVSTNSANIKPFVRTMWEAYREQTAESTKNYAPRTLYYKPRVSREVNCRRNGVSAGMLEESDVYDVRGSRINKRESLELPPGMFLQRVRRKPPKAQTPSRSKE